MIPFFLELFAGTARLSAALAQEGWLTLRWDVLDGEAYDLTKRSRQALLRGWLRAGYLRGFHGGFPCNSWSRARDRGGGPPRLRSADHIWGLADLKPWDEEKVRVGNVLVRFMVSFCFLAISLSVPWTIENPARSYAWLAPPMARLLKASGVNTWVTEYCMFGLPWRKSTWFVAFLVDLSHLDKYRCTGRVCARTGARHEQLTGTNGAGQFKTKVAEPYPRRLCRILAQGFISEHARARATQFQILTAWPGQRCSSSSRCADCDDTSPLGPGRKAATHVS